jgi:hypothetical protein
MLGGGGAGEHMSGAFAWTGRPIDRWEFLGNLMLTDLCGVIAINVGAEAGSKAVILTSLAICYAFHVYFSMRRLNDIGTSPLLAFLWLIPVIDIVLFLFLLLAPTRQFRPSAVGVGRTELSAFKIGDNVHHVSLGSGVVENADEPDALRVFFHQVGKAFPMSPAYLRRA